MTEPRARKRRRGKRKKLPMALGLAELADAAIERHYERPCAPRVLIKKIGTGWRFASPYAAQHEQRWEALLFEAFGTRSGAIMNHFLDVLTRLVGDGCWDEGRHCWMPPQEDFDAMIAIVHSLKPENEAQAAYAAQLCALHLSAMKLGEQAAKSRGDSRTRTVLNKTVRAYGDGLERMARLQGKIAPRTVNQTIQVVYCDNRQVQITGGVAPDCGQPHAADGSAVVQRAALPSPCPNGAALPLPSSERQARVPNARWIAWLWRAFGPAQR